MECACGRRLTFQPIAHTGRNLNRITREWNRFANDRRLSLLRVYWDDCEECDSCGDYDTNVVDNVCEWCRDRLRKTDAEGES